MATVDITNWDEKNTASVGNLSDSSSFTGLQKVQPVKISEGTGSATGDAQFSSSTWSNISSNDDIVVTESDESTTRAYEIESLDTSNNVAWIWVYGSWDSDDSDQIVIGAGTGDGTDYSTGGTGPNPWGQTGINASMVQHLEDEPLTATDSTANNNDGTINGATSTSTGEFDGAADFDGSDDYIQIDSIPALSGDITVAAWTRPEKSDTQWFLNNYGGSNGEQHYILAYGIGTGDNTPTFFIDDGSTSTTASGSSTLSTNSYHQTVGRYDSSTQDMFIDANGDNVGTATHSGNTPNFEERSTALGVNNENKTGSIFEGQMDNVRLYDELKTDNWVQADYDASPKGGQTFFSWSGPQDAATTVTDTAVTTDYAFTAETTQEVNNRFDTVTTTSYSYTANQTTELNNVTDTATTTSYTVTAQTSLDFENFTDTATAATYAFTANQTTEKQVNIDLAQTTAYNYTANQTTELTIDVDKVVTAEYSYTANQTVEQNDVTATAQPASYTFTGKITSETVNFIEQAQTTSYSYSAGETNEVIVTIETAQAAQYTYTANQTTELELARIARTTELNIDIDKDQEKTLSGDIDK